MSHSGPHRFQFQNSEISYFHQGQDMNSATAMGILVKILPNIFNNESTMASSPDGRELNYYDEQTIATIYIDRSGKPARCNLIEVNTEEERRKALEKFAQSKRLVERANFRILLGLITACQFLDKETSHSSVEAVTSNSFRNEMGRDQAVLTDPNNIWSVASGILPGTKWCGLGDIAKNYDDLGPDRKLDKCCRSHDYCPVKVKAFRSLYGLVNWSLYTKSHCQCDAMLYNCLKDAGTPTADVLGNVYFNVIRVQCIEEENPMKCAERDIMNQKCKIWEPVSGVPKRMMFRSAFREF